MTSVLTAPAARGPEPSRPRRRKQLRLPHRSTALPATTALWSMATLSLLALWFVGYVLLIGASQEQGDQHRLFNRFRAQLAQATAPVSVAGEGQPVALLDAPSGGLTRQVVVEGTSSLDLQAGPGHRRDTVLPGQVGVSVLYGKGVTFGAPFQRIGRMRAGDPVSVITAQGHFTYRVTGVRRGGDPLPPLPAGGSGRLTLVTVEGAGWRARWAPTRQVYVDSVLVTAQPAGRRGAVTPAEQALEPDKDALLPLVLWLEAVVAVVVLALLAVRRWGRWQVWLVASPVLVAVLVGASSDAAALLPNLL